MQAACAAAMPPLAACRAPHARRLAVRCAPRAPRGGGVGVGAASAGGALLLAARLHVFPLALSAALWNAGEGDEARLAAAALASVCIVNSLPLVAGPRGAREGLRGPRLPASTWLARRRQEEAFAALMEAQRRDPRPAPPVFTKAPTANANVSTFVGIETEAERMEAEAEVTVPTAGTGVGEAVTPLALIEAETLPESAMLRPDADAQSLTPNAQLAASAAEVEEAAAEAAEAAKAAQAAAEAQRVRGEACVLHWHMRCAARAREREAQARRFFKLSCGSEGLGFGSTPLPTGRKAKDTRTNGGTPLKPVSSAGTTSRPPGSPSEPPLLADIDDAKAVPATESALALAPVTLVLAAAEPGTARAGTRRADTRLSRAVAMSSKVASGAAPSPLPGSTITHHQHVVASVNHKTPPPLSSLARVAATAAIASAEATPTLFDAAAARQSRAFMLRPPNETRGALTVPRATALTPAPVLVLVRPSMPKAITVATRRLTQWMRLLRKALA